MSKSAVGRLYGIDRRTVAKILLHSVPPGYRRTALPVRAKLDPFILIIDQILEDDKWVIKKQRHTGKRIHALLRDEHGFSGSITIVTDFVREKQRRTREVFVPLAHLPRHAQVDFGETLGVIDGIECKLHYFEMALAHSDAFFIKAYPAETTEAFCDGHNAAFAFFRGVSLESGGAPEWQRLAERREAYAGAQIPVGGLFVTAGVDVQKDRIEIDVWAWGRGLESWLVDHIIIAGGLDDPACWDKLAELLGRTWACANGAVMVIGKLAIDTGYEAPAVYAWARKQGFDQVSPINGLEGFKCATPVSGPTFVDATIGGK
jgi:hypothetical protein